MALMSWQGSCFRELGRQYKFYFAMENNDCSDYITEKVWHHCFEHNMVPLVRDTVFACKALMHVAGVGQVCQLLCQPA